MRLEALLVLPCQLGAPWECKGFAKSGQVRASDRVSDAAAEKTQAGRPLRDRERGRPTARLIHRAMRRDIDPGERGNNVRCAARRLRAGGK